MDAEKRLIALIQAGGMRELEAFFDGMPEAERRALAKTALAQLKLGLAKQATSPDIPLSYRPRADRDDDAVEAAALSVWATGGGREFSEVFPCWLPDPPMAVFWSRSDAVIQGWAARLDDYELGSGWEITQRLVRSGRIELPREPEYTIGMIYAARDEAGALLQRYPELLDEAIWAIFAVESPALSTVDPVDGTPGCWSTALIEAMEDGRIPRARLLQSSLQALQAGFSPYACRWYMKLFDALSPSPAELGGASEIFLQLLAAPADNVIGWALKKVKALYKHKAYTPPERLPAALRPALSAEGRGTVKSAISLLGQLARAKGGPRAPALNAACLAFAHPDPGVQEAALKLLERYPLVLLSDQGQALDGVTAALRERLEARLGVEPSAAEASAGATPDASMLAEDVRQAYRIPELLEPLAPEGLWSIPGARFSFGALPELSLRAPLTPIERWPELIERSAELIEGGGQTEDVELVLDGFSRLCATRPPGLASLAAPLLKRVRGRLKSATLRGAPFASEGPIADLCGLIYVWGEGAAPKRACEGAMIRVQLPKLDTPLEGWNRGGLQAALSSRVFWLAERVAAGLAAPLLSAPTHEGAWIEASQLVERVRRAPSEALSDERWRLWRRVELQLALLRLAPEGRAEALARLPEGPQEYLQALRYALGGRAEIGTDPQLWAAAARASTRAGPDEAVCAAFDSVDERIARPASYDPRVHLPGGRPAACEAEESDLATPSFGLEIGICRERRPPIQDPALQAPLPILFEELDSYAWALESVGDAAVTARRSVWPAGRAAAHAFALCSRPFEAFADNTQGCKMAFIESLLDPGAAIGPVGALLLFSGFGTKNPGARSLAIDAAQRAIDEGRLGSDTLALALKRHLDRGALIPGRLADSLGELASGSEEHSAVVKLALEPLCLRASSNPGRTSKPAPKERRRELEGLGDLMELLLQLSALTSCGLAEPHRDALKGLSGSSKLARAARELLKLPRNPERINRARQALAKRRIEVAIRRSSPIP